MQRPSLSEELEPHNLEMHLDAASFYHVESLGWARIINSLSSLLFFFNSVNISGHPVLILFGVLLRMSQIFLFEPIPSWVGWGWGDAFTGSIFLH